MNTEKEFKELIWSENGKVYLKQLFKFNDREEYYTCKDKNSLKSDRYYIKDKDLFSWAHRMKHEYDNEPKYFLFRALLEKRKGQFSNGTLYSSSRLIAELFAKKDNRTRLLREIKAKDINPDNYKWYLEYPLPIEGIDGSVAHLDLVAENEKCFIGIECKMKEIYKDNGEGYFQDFKIAYKDILKGFKELKTKLINNKLRVFINNENEKCNFYYKQQICHLLGMKNYKKTNEKDFCFMNLVFDPTDEKLDNKSSNIIDAFERYCINENRVMKILKKYFKEEKIKYCGMLNQNLKIIK